jgi:hypothetical protein
MADIKISALPASTTPLDGTEVLPIVQGTTTKQVSVANLTASRAVSAASFNPSSSTVPTNGVYLPAANSLGFATNTAEKMRLDSAGNLSIGVTPPNAWGSSYKAYEAINVSLFGSSAAAFGVMIENAYFNGTNYIYKINGGGALYRQLGSESSWWNAPTGTAGATATFTQAMTLTSTGYLGVATTAPSQYITVGAGNSQVNGFGVDYTGSGGSSNVMSITANTATAEIKYFSATNYFPTFYSNNAERMRIFSSGGVSIGNTTDKGAASLNVSGLIFPQQATTAAAPAYVKGAIYFDTTLNKLRVGGATAWETITSV